MTKVNVYPKNNVTGKSMTKKTGTSLAPTAAQIEAQKLADFKNQPEVKKALRDGFIQSVSYVADEYERSGSRTEIITAKNGVFCSERYQAYNVVSKISPIGSSQLDEYKEPEGLELSVPLIPIEGLQIAYSFFFDIYEGKNNTKKESEAMIQFMYAVDGYTDDLNTAGVIAIDNNWFAYIPEQSISHAAVNYQRNATLEATYNCVLDMHSHDNMSAFFSGTDDRDEQEPRFYAVLGSMPWTSTRTTAKSICRYQTKHNNILARNICSLFSIFEMPTLDELKTESALVNLLLETAANYIHDDYVIYEYSELAGRLETSDEMLDRCKLTHSYAKPTTTTTGKYTGNRGYTPYGYDDEDWWKDDYGYGVNKTKTYNTNAYVSPYKQAKLDDEEKLLIEIRNMVPVHLYDLIIRIGLHTKGFYQTEFEDEMLSLEIESVAALRDLSLANIDADDTLSLQDLDDIYDDAIGSEYKSLGGPEEDEEDEETPESLPDLQDFQNIGFEETKS